MSFSHPIFLFLIVALPYIWILHRKSKCDLSPARKLISTIIRTIMMLLLISALAGMQIIKYKDELGVIFLVDVSDSVRDKSEPFAKAFIKQSLEHQKATDKAGIILFGSDAYIETRMKEDLALETFHSVPKTSDTDISRGIRLAMGVFPQNIYRRIVLISDGNETRGSAFEEGVIAQSNNVEISSVPVSASPEEDLVVEKLIAPQDAAIGEPFEIKVVVNSKAHDEGKLWITRNGIPIAVLEDAEFSEGKNVFTIKDELEKSGFYNYGVRLESDDDKISQNNVSYGFTSVAGKPKLLLVNPSQYLAQLFAEEENLDVYRANAGAIPYSADEINQFDAILMEDVPAFDLSTRQLTLLQNYVRDLGGGFVMVGGENSFGVGGYFQTPVEETLPVNMSVKGKRYFPSLALMLAIDKSGSMSTLSGGIEKIEIAKRAAVASVELLMESDQVGVVAFDGAAKWVVNLTPASQKGKIKSGIGSLRAGGGTNIYPALSEAVSVLKNTDAKLKHIILLSDGMSAPGNYTQLTSQAANAKITISTVAVGKDSDVSLMQEIARRGNGRFYLTENPQNIPQIFTKETLLASKSYILEEMFTPQKVAESQMLLGIESPPPLEGYVVTSGKPLAEISMVSHKDDPILASWQYGLGRSVAFTSDAESRWAKQWIGWEKFDKFWKQSMRWAMREIAEEPYQIRYETEQGNTKIHIEAMDKEGNFQNFLELEGVAIAPDLQRKRVKIRQTAPGHYEGEFESEDVGSYTFTIYEKGKLKTQTIGIPIPYSSEYKNVSTNTVLLAQLAELTDGTLIKEPNAVFRKPDEKVRYLQEIWRNLLIIAMFLFLLDVAIRRVMIGREQFDYLLTKIKKAQEKSPETSEKKSIRRRITSQLLKTKETIWEEEEVQPKDVKESKKKVNQIKFEDVPETEIEPPPETKEETEKPEKKEEESVKSDYMSRLMEAKKRAKKDRE